MRFWFLSALLLSLVSCPRTGDNFNPQITIIEPTSGAVTKKSTLTVKISLIDDAGIDHFYVNDRDLLSINPFAKQRGQKLIDVSFIAQLGSGKVDYNLRATDVNGRESSQVFSLTVDNVLPKLQDVHIESQGNSIYLSGIASDNFKVSKIFVNQQPLTVNTGQNVPFYIQIKRPNALEVIIQDGAGNRLQKNFGLPRYGGALQYQNP